MPIIDTVSGTVVMPDGTMIFAANIAANKYPIVFDCRNAWRYNVTEQVLVLSDKPLAELSNDEINNIKSMLVNSVPGWDKVYDLEVHSSGESRPEYRRYYDNHCNICTAEDYQKALEIIAHLPADAKWISGPNGIHFRKSILDHCSKSYES